MTDMQKGAAAAFLSYVWWGAMPPYWKLLSGVSSVEILLHRVVWSAAFMLLLLAASRRLGAAFQFVRAKPRDALWFVGSGLLITFNWGLYIWAVNAGHVLDTSLGYYMNPLLAMLFGRIFFGEHMRGAQKAAIALAVAGVAVQVAALRVFPVVALSLALSFGFYGVLKKKIPADPSVSLTIETLAVAPAALAGLAFLEHTGAASYPYGAQMNLLLAGAGFMTSGPLLLFAYGARRVSLTTIGFLQYVSPTMTFLLGTFVYREPMNVWRLAAFALIWCAVALYTADAVVHTRREKRLCAGGEDLSACVRTNFYKK